MGVLVLYYDNILNFQHWNPLIILHVIFIYKLHKLNILKIFSLHCPRFKY